jgi:hypothetical protein
MAERWALMVCCVLHVDMNLINLFPNALASTLALITFTAFAFSFGPVPAPSVVRLPGTVHGISPGSLAEPFLEFWIILRMFDSSGSLAEPFLVFLVILRKPKIHMAPCGAGRHFTSAVRTLPLSFAFS